MRVDLFDFDLPPELIAQHPVRPRDAARLLVVRGASLEDRSVRDLPALLRRGDLLVFNDTRVIPARLLGRRGAAKIEVTLHQPVGGAERSPVLPGAPVPMQRRPGLSPCGAPSRGRRVAAAPATACASARTSRPR